MATILIVDDEPGIRTVIRKILTTAEHKVLEAARGADALALLPRHREIDIVFVDVYMPGMNGIELTIRLQQLPLQPAIIVMTGGGPAGVADVIVPAAFLGVAATLTKPFTAAQLLHTVDDVLFAQRD